MQTMEILDNALGVIRQYGVFEKWTDDEVKKEIARGFLEDSIAYIPEDENSTKVKAICIAKWHDSCSMHITCIAGPKGTLREFLFHLHKKYPNVRNLSGYRNGILKQYKLR